MILTDFRDFVRTRRIVSLHELSLHFKCEASAADAMMQRWVDKGLVERITMDAGKCGACMMCPGDVKIHYEWKETKGERPVTFMKMKKD